MKKRSNLATTIFLLLAFVVTNSLVGCSSKKPVIQYSLSITVEGQGVVEPVEGNHIYSKDTLVALSATADTANGWVFSKWNGPNGAEVRDNKVLMNMDKSITAVFVKSQYNVNITVTPDDAGRVDAELLTAVQSVEHGETVRLTAVSNTGYIFDHWEGDLTGNNNPQDVLIASEKNITAVFVRVYDLTVNITPDGAGIVQELILSAQGIEHGKTVQLTAVSNTGYHFDHWEGDLTGTRNPDTLVMEADKNVTAVFVMDIYGKVYGANTGNGIESITLRFSDGSSTMTDTLGNWTKKVAYGTTVTPTESSSYYAQVFEPTSIYLNQPSDRINFAFRGYSYVGAFDALGTGVGEFRAPRGITVANNGKIYVSDTANHRIQMYDGNQITVLGSRGSTVGKFLGPMGIAIDNSGNIFVVDSDNHRIQKYNGVSWSIFAGTGSAGSGNGQFSSPNYIAIDSVGNIYVVDAANHRIQKFNSNGAFLRSWGSQGSGEGQFRNPRGVAVDGFNNIYVVDHSNHRIQRFDSEGNLLGILGGFGSGDGQMTNPHSIAVDSSNNVYVGEIGNNRRIQEFSSNGNFVRKWGSHGDEIGQFNLVMDIAVDNDGNIFIIDSKNDLLNFRIQLFAAID